MQLFFYQCKIAYLAPFLRVVGLSFLRLDIHWHGCNLLYCTLKNIYHHTWNQRSREDRAYRNSHQSSLCCILKYGCTNGIKNVNRTHYKTDLMHFIIIKTKTNSLCPLQCNTEFNLLIPSCYLIYVQTSLCLDFNP